MPSETNTLRSPVTAENSPLLGPDQSYSIDLGYFSGPMDLLLHLVQRQEVPVSQVEMSVIAEQYLQIISKVAVFDLERASEYLVIAAQLLAMKSQSLLPAENLPLDPDMLEGEHDPDFLEELRRRLRLYELTKQRALTLNEMPQLGIDSYARRDRSLLTPAAETLTEEQEESHTLAVFFVGLLKRIGETVKSFRIRLESVSVVSCMMKLIDLVHDAAARGPRSFWSLVRSLRNEDPKLSQRSALIGGFIAVLELMKRGVLTAEQVEGSNEIIVTAGASLDPHLPMSSEFDSEKIDRESSTVVSIEKYRKPELSEQSDTQAEEVNRG